jgi:hypothetical protein
MSQLLHKLGNRKHIALVRCGIGVMQVIAGLSGYTVLKSRRLLTVQQVCSLKMNHRQIANIREIKTKSCEWSHKL